MRKCTNADCITKNPRFYEGRNITWCIDCMRRANRENYRKRNNTKPDNYRYENWQANGGKPSTFKICKRCGENKRVYQFNENDKHSDGLQAYCKACVKAYNAARYKRLTVKKQNTKKRWEPTGNMYSFDQRFLLVAIKAHTVEGKHYPAHFVEKRDYERLVDDCLIEKRAGGYWLTVDPLIINQILNTDGYYSDRIKAAAQSLQL